MLRVRAVALLAVALLLGGCTPAVSESAEEGAQPVEEVVVTDAPAEEPEPAEWPAPDEKPAEDSEPAEPTPEELYAALEAALREMGVLNLNACIGCPEAEDEYLTCNSVEFHRCLGYRWVGQFHSCGYKFGRWYDMVWMEKMLGLHSAVPEPVRPFPAVRPTLVGNVLEW